MSSESKQRKQRGQQQTRRGLPACNFWLDKSAEGWRPGMWGIADEKHAGVVDAKPIWISPARRPASFSVGRRAAFSQRQQAVQPVLRQWIRPLLLFLLAGVLQLQLPLARHPRKSACEAKNVLCCKRLQGPGGRVNELPSIRKCRSSMASLGSFEGLPRSEARRGRQR